MIVLWLQGATARIVMPPALFLVALTGALLSDGILW